MSEHFDGDGHMVHFSNGGAESLLQAWIALGERLGPPPEGAPVLAFLRGQLAHGYGWRSFSLGPPPDELAAPERLRFLGRIVADFARELARPEPDPSLTDISWDRGLRLSWLSRQLDLYEMIGAALPAGCEPLPPLALALSPADRLDCELRRTLDRKQELRRSRGGDAEAMLVLTDRIVALAREQGRSRLRSELLVEQYDERSDLLLELGDRAGAAAALRAATEEDIDIDLRQALEELAADLVRQSPGETMTEAEWTASDDLYRMLRFLRGRLSDRGFRLFACACARRAWHRLPVPEGCTAVEVAERLADGLASAEELSAARRATWACYSEAGHARLPPAAAAVAVIGDEAVAAARDAAVAALAAVVPAGQPHRQAARTRERLAQCHLLRDIAGDPFRPAAVERAWLTWGAGTIPRLARAIYEERAFDRMPILADALEEAGCDRPDILGHCRGPGKHARGCWLLDLLRELG